MTDATQPAMDDDANAGQAVLDVVREMMEAAGLEVSATLASEDAEAVEVTLEGGDARLLIGKQGQTLNALQYLVGLMVARRVHRRLRVTLDADNYRGRRAETLESMARELAEQVRAYNQEAVMDPLNAAERRIVHNALLDEPGVSTYSEGEEPDRRVVISPNAPE